MRKILPGSLALAVALAVPPPDKAPPASSRPSPAAAKPAPKPTPYSVLTGSVRGPDGKPVDGALVLYRSLAAASRELAATTRTDAEGRFRAALKTAGLVYVRVTDKGLARGVVGEVPPDAPLAVVP